MPGTMGAEDASINRLVVPMDLNLYWREKGGISGGRKQEVWLQRSEALLEKTY